MVEQMKTSIRPIALAVFAFLLSPVAFAGTTVEHGDGETWSFRASDPDTGWTLFYTWTSNPGDIGRTGPDGEANYKINARNARVILYVTAAGPEDGYLGEGTAHLTIFGDIDGNIVGNEYFNFFSHGELELLFGDFDFAVRRVDRNGEEKQLAVILEPSE